MVGLLMTGGRVGVRRPGRVVRGVGICMKVHGIIVEPVWVEFVGKVRKDRVLG
jgi:hypothetical protein